MLRVLLSIVSIVGLFAYKSELVEQDPATIGEHVVTKRPHEYLKLSDLPSSYDLRLQGLLTTDLNQHIPVYCGRYLLYSLFIGSLF